MALIFFLSSRPSVQASAVDWQDFTLKKTAHFIEYFVLAVLLFRSFRYTVAASLKVLLLVTFTITILYATSDELHQSFVPGREPHIRDVTVDTLGALTAIWLIYYRFRKITIIG